MTIPSQHLEHKVGYQPPDNGEKISVRCGVGGAALIRRLTAPGICA